MQNYDIKRGHFKNIDGSGLENIMKELFGSVKKEGNKFVSSYGALDSISAWTEGKNTLWVDMQMNPKVDDEAASKTIKNYNEFLSKATGFTSKQRRNRLNKKAKEGKL